MLDTTPPQSVSKNITCTSVRIRGIAAVTINNHLGRRSKATAKVRRSGESVDKPNQARAEDHCKIDRTALIASSTLTAFIQRKSIGHSRKKHGLHST